MRQANAGLHRRVPLWLAGCAVLALAACTPGQADLSAWVEQQRGATQPRLVPLQPPQPHTPATYTGHDGVSPFSPGKLGAPAPAQAHAADGLVPELQRPREPLEALPLERIVMVGTLQRGTDSVALVRAEGRLHQVRVGNRMGQNFGRIIAIDADRISLREMARQPSGTWVERSATLLLQEASDP